MIFCAIIKNYPLKMVIVMNCSKTSIFSQKNGVLILNAFFLTVLLIGTLTSNDKMAHRAQIGGQIERIAQPHPKESAVLEEPLQQRGEPSRLVPTAIIRDNLIASFNLNETRATKFAGWIHDAHKESGVPVGYMVALIATESSFRYEAVSHAGAVGPAQVTPRFWEKWCKSDLKNPRENIICGAKILAHYKTQCHDWDCAFKKYNVGPAGYHRAKHINAMRRYIAKIDENLKIAGEFGFLNEG